MITANLNNYRQSPRKVRLVANLIRGKSATEALGTLTFLSKKATGPLSGLLNSAIANAKNNHSIDKEGLFIKEIRVDVGAIMKRSMPRARGTAYRINKRTSHIILVLAPIAEKPLKKSEKSKIAKEANKAKVAALAQTPAKTKTIKK